MSDVKYVEKINKLYETKGFKYINLSRSVYIWKDGDNQKAPVFLGDSKNDTFALAIGTVSDWKTSEARDKAMQYFVEKFAEFPKSLRAILDKDNPSVTLKSFVQEMMKVGLQGKKFGYAIEDGKETVSKPVSKTLPAKKAPVQEKSTPKTSKISDVLKENLKKKASKIAREQGVEVLTPDEVDTLEDV